MATPSIDLDAYFARVGYRGPREPTFDVLTALHLCHLQAIAFENLDSLLRRPVELDLPALQAKLVHGRRGGYCFEHGLLYRAVLEALGFDVTNLAARVLMDAPEGAERARTHVFLHIRLDGRRYHVDVGFGGLTPTAPLLFEPGTEQATPHEPCRFVETGAGYDLETRVGDEWKLLYRFDLTPHLFIDHVVGNHYVATHPDSAFRTAIMAARATPDGRHTLINDRLSFRQPDGQVETQTLPDADALLRAYDAIFGIAVPDRAGLAAAFERQTAADTRPAASPAPLAEN